MANFKTASAADEKCAAQLLETIRQENPRLWPYGLSMKHFGPGDLFLVQKQASDETVGFVGWQEKDLNGRRTGFYSIGLLPAYRGQGLAKAAVQKLIAERAPGVEQVRALVADGNVSSEKLAEALGVPVMRKQASPLTKQILKNIGKFTGAGFLNAAIVDPMVHGEKGLILGAAQGKDYDGFAWADALKNFAAGGYTPFAKTLVGKFGGPGFALSSTYGAKAIRQQGASNSTAREHVKALLEQASAMRDSAKGKLPPWAILGGAAALTGGVGYAAHRIAKAIKEKSEAPVNIQTTQGGRLKVTLPTKNPGDTETVIDVPFDQETAFSGALRSRLALDTRRRLYAETKQRVRHRIPRNIDDQIAAGLPE